MIETPAAIKFATGWWMTTSQSENNYFAEMRSGSEAGSHLRLIDFVYHSTLGFRVIKKKKKNKSCTARNADPSPWETGALPSETRPTAPIPYVDTNTLISQTVSIKRF